MHASETSNPPPDRPTPAFDAPIPPRQTQPQESDIYYLLDEMAEQHVKEVMLAYFMLLAKGGRGGGRGGRGAGEGSRGVGGGARG